MNMCVFMGRLTADPEMKSVGEKGTSLTKFCLAVDNAFQSGSEKSGSFFNMQAWGKTAENIHKYFKKGNPILVRCSARQNNWEDKDGNKRSGINFDVQSFNFIPRVKSESVEKSQTEEPETEASFPF